MEIMRRTLSAFLAMVMVFGMLPVSAWASETEPVETEETVIQTEEATEEPAEAAEETVVEEPTAAPTETSVPEETSSVETTAAAETEPAETSGETESVETEPSETEAPVTEPAVTEPEETVEETEPLVATAPEADAAEEETEWETVWVEPDYGPSHWYTEQETVTWTEDVTVVEPDENGGYRLYDTTETYSDTYSVRIPGFSEPVQTYGITELDDGNGYMFDSFADLKELASQEYTQWTAAVYNGTYPFVIEESIALPAYLNLRFVKEGSSYDDNASMVIPAGVTFSNSRFGSIRIGHLEVAGTFNVNETLNVVKSLKVTGKIRLTGNTLLMEMGADLSGESKITVDGGWGPFWHKQAKTLQEIKDCVAAANSDTTGWKYLLNVNTWDNEIHLAEELTIPANMELDIEGGNPFHIDNGGTLTLNMTWGESSTDIEVHDGGKFVNNSREFYIFNPIMVSFNASYSGTGKLLVAMDAGVDTWSGLLIGVDPADVAVSEVHWGNGSWWIVRCLEGMERLDAPTNLQWGKRTVESYGSTRVLDGPGHIFWRVGQRDEDQVLLRVYNEDGDHIGTFNWGFGGQNTNARSVPGFIELDPESGSYYFTVTSVARGDSPYVNSVTVESDVWTYEKTGTPMPTCSDPKWEWPMATWQDPDMVGEHTTHQVEFFYAPDLDTEPECIGRGSGICGQQTQMWMDQVQRYGRGYYSFRVRVEPDDITVNTIGDWSEMSEAYYYDPDIPVYTEQYLKDQIKGGVDYIQLDQDLMINGSYTLPEGVTLEINGGSITVGNGAVLTLNGELQIANGKLMVYSGGTLNLNTSLQAWENAVIDLRGRINYGNEWAYVCRHYNGGWVDCTIENVPMERQALYVELTDENEASWVEAISVAETATDYGRVFIMVVGQIELPCNLTINENAILHVDRDNTNSLTVPNGKTIINRGEIYVWQGKTLINRGVIDNYRGLQIYGTLDNRGEINLYENETGGPESILCVYESGTVRNDRNVNIYPNSYLWQKGSWYGNAANYIRYLDSREQLAAAMESMEPGSILCLSGNVILDRNLTIPESVYLHIVSGGCLEVSEGVTLTMNGQIHLMGGALTVQPGGRLNINTGLYVRNGGTLEVYGDYTFGKNAYGVSGDIHRYYGESCTIDGLDPLDVIQEFQLNGNSDVDTILAAFVNDTSSRNYLQIHTSLELENLNIPANGEVHVWQKLTLNGTTNCEGLICTYDMGGSGEVFLENNGTLNLLPGAKMTVYGAVENNGTTYVYAGAALERNADWRENPPIFLGGGTNDSNWGMTHAKLVSQINALKKKGGTVTLNKAVVLEKDLTLPANVSLRIEEGGSLLVPEGVTLTLNGQVTLRNGGLWTEVGSTLKVNNYLYVQYNGTLDVQGEISFKDSWSLVCRYYEQDWLPCEIKGNIPMKNQGLYVMLNKNNEAYWSDAVETAENATNYGRVFIIALGQIELPGDLTINENTILHVDQNAGHGLTLSEDNTITNYGEIYVWNGNFFYNSGTIENYGGIHVYAAFDNKGTIHMHPGSYLNIYENGQVTNFGTVNLNVGSQLWKHKKGTWEYDAPVYLGGRDNLRPSMSHADLQKKVKSGSGWYDLTKNVTLTKDLTVKNQLSIGSDVTLIVPAGVTLTVDGAIFLQEGADLIIEEGATLVNNNFITTSADKEHGGILYVGGDYYGGYGSVNIEINADVKDEWKTPNVVGLDPWYQTARVENVGYGTSDADLCVWAMENLADDYGAVEVWTDDIFLMDPLTIPQNATLLIIPTWFDIEHGTQSDWARLHGDVTVYGQLIPNAYYNGTPCNLEILGDVEIMDGGGLWVYGNVVNRGSVKAHVGSWYGLYNAQYGGTWSGNPIQDVSGMPQSELEAAMEGGNTYWLTEGVLLEKDLEIDNLIIDEGGHIVIPEGKTLTVTGRLDLNGGNLTVEGTLINNGTITLASDSDSLLMNWYGTYIAGENAELVRDDFDAERIDFSGGVDGIPLEQQSLGSVTAENEDHLRMLMTFMEEVGFKDISISVGEVTMWDDMVIPENVSVCCLTEWFNSAKLTVNGTLEFVEGGGMINDDTVLVGKTGTLSVPGLVYTGAAPVVTKGGVVMPCAESLSFADNNIEVNPAEAANGCLNPTVGGEGAMQYVVWTSSNKKVIDPANIVSNGDGTYSIRTCAPGKATLTATTVATDENGQPFTASVNVTVVSVQADALELHSEWADGNGCITLQKEAETQTFRISPAAMTAEGLQIPQNAKSIKWSTSDKKLAAIATNADGSVTVTVKGGAHGVAQITAKLNDGSGLSSTMKIVVQDPAPRLGSAKLTVNPQRFSGARTTLVTSYGNEIEGVSIRHANFLAKYDEGVLTVTSVSESLLKNSTVKTVLDVTCMDGNTYSYNLTLTVKRSTPTITVKQAKKLDLFYTDSVSGLTVTAKDGTTVEHVELTGTNDFYLADGELRFTDSLIWNCRNNAKYKPDTKATLLVYLEDYVYPVEKAVTISTTASKLTLVTDPGSSTVNTKLNTSPYSIAFRVLNKKTKEALDLNMWNVDYNGVGMDETGRIVLNLGYTTKNRTITFYVQQDNWMRSVKVTHKVSYSTKTPELKLGTSTLTLYGPYPKQAAQTTAVLSHGNLEIDHIAVAFSGEQAAKIVLRYADGVLTARLADGITPENGPGPGTYTYTVTPYVRNHMDEVVALKAVTVKVKMVNNSGLPKAKLGTKSVKLNTALAGEEIAKIPVTFKDTTHCGLWIHRFEGADDKITLTYEDGFLKVKLNTDEIFKKTYTLMPIAKDDIISSDGWADEGGLPTVELTVTSYAASEIKVAQSGKGKLDAIRPDSEIVYTIGKITNALGPVDSVELAGQDEDLFEVSEIATDSKGKQTFRLKLKDDVTYSTSRKYKVQFVYTVCGTTSKPSDVSFKVTQSALKVSAPEVQYYLSQDPVLRTALRVTSPDGAKLRQISINTDKTSAALLAALSSHLDGNLLAEEPVAEVTLSLDVSNTDSLQAGKSYKLVLDVIPQGGTANGKPTQVTVTVKVSK